MYGIPRSGKGTDLFRRWRHFPKGALLKNADYDAVGGLRVNVFRLGGAASESLGMGDHPDPCRSIQSPVHLIGY